MFLGELKKLTLDPKFIAPLQYQLEAIFSRMNEERFEEAEALERRKKELEKKMKDIRRRVFLEELDKEIADEFMPEMKEELEQIQTEIGNAVINRSNFSEYIGESLEIAANLPVLWENGDFEARQRLQKVVYPEGFHYHKQTGIGLTSRVNDLFAITASYARFLEENGGNEGGSTSCLCETQDQIPLTRHPHIQRERHWSKSLNCSAHWD